MIESNAIFSPSRKYRYTLFRRWSEGSRIAAFIGLNPSTADETKNDPTVTRCVNYAKRWEYDGVWMLNAFAFRSTNPKLLYVEEDPIGPENDFWIDLITKDKNTKIVLCCWGTHGNHLNRGKEIFKRLPKDKATCLNTTKDGHPGHPLYLKSSLQPQSFLYSIG